MKQIIFDLDVEQDSVDFVQLLIAVKGIGVHVLKISIAPPCDPT